MAKPIEYKGYLIEVTKNLSKWRREVKALNGDDLYATADGLKTNFETGTGYYKGAFGNCTSKRNGVFRAKLLIDVNEGVLPNKVSLIKKIMNLYKEQHKQVVDISMCVHEWFGIYLKHNRLDVIELYPDDFKKLKKHAVNSKPHIVNKKGSEHRDGR